LSGSSLWSIKSNYRWKIYDHPLYIHWEEPRREFYVEIGKSRPRGWPVQYAAPPPSLHNWISVLQNKYILEQYARIFIRFAITQTAFSAFKTWLHLLRTLLMRFSLHKNVSF